MRNTSPIADTKIESRGWPEAPFPDLRGDLFLIFNNDGNVCLTNICLDQAILHA